MALGFLHGCAFKDKCNQIRNPLTAVMSTFQEYYHHSSQCPISSYRSVVADWFLPAFLRPDGFKVNIITSSSPTVTPGTDINELHAYALFENETKWKSGLVCVLAQEDRFDVVTVLVNKLYHDPKHADLHNTFPMGFWRRSWRWQFYRREEWRKSTFCASLNSQNYLTPLTGPTGNWAKKCGRKISERTENMVFIYSALRCSP